MSEGLSCAPVPMSATSSGTDTAATRAASIKVQSLPSCAGRAAADRANMNPTSSRLTALVMTGARPISGTSTSSPRCSESQRRARARLAPPTRAAMINPAGAGTQP